MINKKNLWFLTLFSLILVLSVYYITMPSELLLTNNSSYVKEAKTTEKKETKTTTSIEDSEVITALKVANDEKIDEELDALKLILSDSKSTTDEKNNAFEKMKNLNQNKTKEQEIEKILESSFKYKTFVKIEGTQIKVVVDQTKHDTSLANNIMRKVQESFNEQVYITVEFKG